jgi:hypothetical protein
MENATETFKNIATAIFEKVTCDEINSMVTSSITSINGNSYEIVSFNFILMKYFDDKELRAASLSLYDNNNKNEV